MELQVLMELQEQMELVELQELTEQAVLMELVELQVLMELQELTELVELQELQVPMELAVKTVYLRVKYTTSMNHKIQMFQDTKFYQQNHQVQLNKRLQQI
jgi:hypothetical protein